MLADALHRSVTVGARVFRKQLQRIQPAVGRTRDHVRERAAAIDPELPEPAGFRRHIVLPNAIFFHR